MPSKDQFITLRELDATAVIAPQLGAWLLRYTRHFPRHGYVDALHYSEEVVQRYPNQMYAGNPLLFPLVSFNRAGGREHYYDWRETTYAMPQHGFARRLPWKTVQVSETTAVMELRSSIETEKSYPFQFLHRVRYELKSGRIHFHQSIQNQGKAVMPFSTGIHPYFNVPFGRESRREDCYLEVPRARRVIPRENWESWTSEPSGAQRLSVSEDVSGTLFLTDLEKAEIELVDPKARLKARLNFEGAPAHKFVAFWSKSTREPFYCIEPWTALPNSFARSETEFIEMQPGEEFTSAMWISLEEN